jgi:hypothetical protein
VAIRSLGYFRYKSGLENSFENIAMTKKVKEDGSKFKDRAELFLDVYRFFGTGRYRLLAVS